MRSWDTHRRQHFVSLFVCSVSRVVTLRTRANQTAKPHKFERISQKNLLLRNETNLFPFLSLPIESHNNINIMTMPKISQKDGCEQATSNTATMRPRNDGIPTSIECTNTMQTEACRRSSMASSIGDSGDYQNQPEAYTVSPFQRRSSGPSNKPTIDRKSMPQVPSLRLDDSWGNLSIEDLL